MIALFLPGCRSFSVKKITSTRLVVKETFDRKKNHKILSTLFFFSSFSKNHTDTETLHYSQEQVTTALPLHKRLLNRWRSPHHQENSTNVIFGIYHASNVAPGYYCSNSPLCKIISSKDLNL